ncbi:MAG: hypothetical protein WB581_02860 [Halobacteriota archaeon]
MVSILRALTRDRGHPWQDLTDYTPLSGNHKTEKLSRAKLRSLCGERTILHHPWSLPEPLPELFNIP